MVVVVVVASARRARRSIHALQASAAGAIISHRC